MSDLLDKCINNILLEDYTVEVIDSITCVRYYDEVWDLTEHLDLFKNKDGYNLCYIRYIGNNLIGYIIKPLSESEYNILMNKIYDNA